jgi:hypothetical protein
MSSKRLALIAAVAIIVIGGLVYFVAVPMMQVAAYKKADSRHAQVNDKMVRVYDSFKRDIFTSTDSKLASDKLDLQIARDAVKDAQSALDANTASMTSFSPWPLLEWQGTYSRAKTIDTDEDAYIKKARAFLADYQVLIDFVAKEAELAAEIETTTQDIQTINNYEAPTAMATAIDGIATKLQATLDKEKALTPPAYLKDYYTKSITVAQQMITTFRSMAAATRTLDVAKLNTISTDLNKQTTELERQGQALITNLQTDSPIQRQINDLRAAHTTITAGYAKL